MISLSYPKITVNFQYQQCCNFPSYLPDSVCSEPLLGRPPEVCPTCTFPGPRLWGPRCPSPEAPEPEFIKPGMVVAASGTNRWIEKLILSP